MDEICRLCLKEASEGLNIFDEKGRTIGIAEILRKHFWFELHPGDPISTVICLECWVKVDGFHRLYLQVERVHNLLVNNDTNIGLTQAAIKSNILEDLQNTAPTTEQLEMTMDIKEEYIDTNMWHENIKGSMNKAELNPLEDMESNHDPAEPIKNVMDMVTKNKSDLEIDLCVKEEDESLTGNLPSPQFQKHANVNREDLRTKQQRKATKSGISISEKLKGITKRSRRCKIDKKSIAITKIHNVKKQKRRKMMTERDDDLIKKYISMGCELCPFVGNNFLELTNHFRINHESQKPYVVCCGRKFSKRFLIVQHAYKHEDPEYYKCKECQKVFSDGYVLRSHILASHSADDDLTFSCDQCPKKFSRRYLLDLHKPSHIPPEERSFWCNKCPQPKVFASDHLLQIHTNMRHNKAPNICHVCGKEIRDNQAYEKHVRLHFEDSGPRVKCPHSNCDRWLKDEDNLKQHLRRHNDEGKTFICNECGKVCKNRRSLTSHTNYAHTSETFACEECNKTFKKAITLREHMAQHTGETLYKCPFCTRTFNSNANMHSHKKKMHPLEWDNWRKTKRGSSQQLVASNIKVDPAVEGNDSVFAGNSCND